MNMILLKHKRYALDFRDCCLEILTQDTGTDTLGEALPNYGETVLSFNLEMTTYLFMMSSDHYEWLGNLTIKWQ